MERGILFAMLLQIVYYLALLTLNSKGFDIERKVTATDMMPHPAADTFESPRRSGMAPPGVLGGAGAPPKIH